MQGGKITMTMVLVGMPLLSQSVSPRLRPLPAASQHVVTGPDVGARVPAIRLTDQSGRVRDLRSLTGRHGLLLAFVRSADW